MEENHRFHPLIHPSTITAAAAAIGTTPQQEDDRDLRHLKLVSSNSSIIFRLSFIVFIGIISTWANHEASKGFEITIVNEAGNTSPGKRFHLFYVSNDEATRIVIKASKNVESFLYSNDDDSPTKKPVKHIIFKLVGQKMTEEIAIDSWRDNEFVLNVSPSIMEGTNFRRAMFLAVQQGMARIWLWDGQGEAPKILINGIVEYVTNYLDNLDLDSNLNVAEPPPESTTATACWKLEDSRAVAEFLNYRERRRPGFIMRLNQAMRDGWHDAKLDVALGLSARNLCTTDGSIRYNFSSV